MKKVLFLFMLMLTTLSFAQTEKGNSFIGVSSNSLTGLQYSTQVDSKVKNYGFGVQGGHFVAEDLAVIAGAGYNATRIVDRGTVAESYSYQAGLKYYLLKQIPVQVDYNGVDSSDYLGTQAGYAFFPSKNFSIEPHVRYDFGLKERVDDRFSFGFGFNYFFK